MHALPNIFNTAVIAMNIIMIAFKNCDKTFVSFLILGKKYFTLANFKH